MDKVIWQEGMLLRPQHFQQHDRYLQHQLNTRTLELMRFGWGFFDLKLSPQYLMTGKVVISKAAGIMPDGTLFDISDSVDSLAMDIPNGTNNCNICLALPLVTQHSVESRNQDQRDVVSRFVSRAQTVMDSNAGEQIECHINCGQLDFRLMTEAEAANNWVALPVCRIQDVLPDGSVVLDADFQPAYINAKRSGFICDSLHEVLSLISHRAEILGERVRSAGKLGSAEVGDFLMLQLLNRNEARLRHLQQIDQVHPEQIYQELLALYGELATYQEQRRPEGKLRYKHGDLGECFRQLVTELRQQLSQVLEQHAIRLPLQQRKYGIQVSPLQDHKLLSSATFVLSASANCSTELVRSKLPSQIKIGPVEQIRQMVNLHLSGIPLRPLPVAPRQLPFNTSQAYFSLDIEPEMVARLESSGGFALHVSGDFAGLKLEFWAIRNQ